MVLDVRQTQPEYDRPRPIIVAQPGSLRAWLLETNAVPRDALAQLSSLYLRDKITFADALLRKGLLSGTRLAALQADRCKKRLVDLSLNPANPRLTTMVNPTVLARWGVLPWRIRDGKTVILCHCEERYSRAAPMLSDVFGEIEIGFADPAQIEAALLAQIGPSLKDQAEQQVAPGDSCRTLNYSKLRLLSAAFLSILFIALYFAPNITFTFFTTIALVALACGTGLKVAALVQGWRNPKPMPNKHKVNAASPPVITVLVPLYKEREIAAELICRLQRIDYPREYLDVILVMEETDTCTADTVARTQMPPWFRVFSVPEGSVKTKPRALNFALNFAKGSIIGVYDAEDAPEPQQLRHVVNHFAQAAPEVACLQGILDYYNVRENWLSRCFAIEYATWFRLILPALQSMRLPVPLGGTTLFFRRDILESLGAWDAHNVTEDADLGVRLARHGFRTEMVQTVTYEEANNRIWPWIKQRSRWLKGFAITWAVHMRSPKRLMADLGLRGFVGVQLIFAVAILQFCLAPLLWTFWLVAFGVYHPVSATLPHAMIVVFGSLFLLAEIIGITAGMLAVTGPNHRHLIRWVPTMHVYFPLGALASYKALAELVIAPFYWDKTSHGKSKTQLKTAAEITSNASDGSQKLRLDEHAQLHRQLLDRLPKSP